MSSFCLFLTKNSSKFFAHTPTERRHKGFRELAGTCGFIELFSADYFWKKLFRFDRKMMPLGSKYQKNMALLREFRASEQSDVFKYVRLNTVVLLKKIETLF
jgi:hypothetical protein